MNPEIDIPYTLYDYLDVLWRRRYFFITSVICMPVLALVVALFLPKKYTSETAIAVYSTAPPVMKNESYQPVIEQQYASLAAYLTSPLTLKKIAIQVGMLDPFSDPRQTEAVTSALQKSITVLYVRDNVVKITLVQSRPENIVAILNMMANMAIQQLQEPLTQATQATKTYLKHEIDKQRMYLKAAIAAMKAYEAKNIDYLPTYESVYMNRLQQSTSDLANKKVQYQTLIAQKKALEDALMKVNPALGAITKQISDNNVRLNKLRLIYTENYPEIQSAVQLDRTLQAERAKLFAHFKHLTEEDLQQMWEAATAASGPSVQTNSLLYTQLQSYQNIKLQLKGLDQAIADLTVQHNDWQTKLNKVTQTKQQWLTLNREVEESQRLYDNLITKYVMTKGASGFNNAEQSISVRVVSYPQIPYQSVSRGLFFYMFVGVLSGVVLGISLITVFELMDNTVRRKRVIEVRTGLLVISRVSRMVHG